ncbi:MAG TPA: WecB/TagA/CpsF family glycosyltransferase [Clostridia bacterium]|nr:WecB/TagA/CpsF family glycosyltransferase [Clostridia bacterium]
MSLDNMESIKILGIKINKVTNKEAFDYFVDLLKENETTSIFTPNPEIVMMAQKDDELKKAIFESNLVIPDGIGLIFASRLYNLGLTERVTGFDLMGKMLEYSNRRKLKIFLLGSKPGVAEEAKKNINNKYKNINIVGTHHGYFDEKESLEVLDLINEKKPDILFVALGASRQEKWISHNKKILNASVAMGVGGALDVWAGDVKRAPKFFIKLNLEWLYRLIKQPSRFGRILEIPKFMVKVLLNKQSMER